jgi:hypothetical protein
MRVTSAIIGPYAGSIKFNTGSKELYVSFTCVFIYIYVYTMCIGNTDSNRKIYLKMQSKKNEMGRACGTYGSQEECTGFCWRDLRERDYLEDLGIDGRIILKWILKKWDGRLR